MPNRGSEMIGLSYWEGIELFCRIVAAHDNVSFEENDYKAYISQLPKTASTRLPYVRDVSCGIFGVKKDENDVFQEDKHGRIPNNNWFYAFCKHIRYNESIQFGDDVVEEVESYINTRSNSAYKIPKATKNLYPVPNLRNAYNTSYILYHFDQQVSGNQSKGIITSFLKFESFSKAQIISTTTENTKQIPKIDKYHGYYYASEQVYLEINLSHETDRAKNLHIRLFIADSDIPNFALGTFMNNGETIYVGSVLAIYTDSNLEAFIPSFIISDSNEFSALPQSVKSYFNDQDQGILRVPINLISEDKFEEWCRDNNSHYEEIQDTFYKFKEYCLSKRIEVNNRVIEQGLIWFFRTGFHNRISNTVALKIFLDWYCKTYLDPKRRPKSKL